MILQEILIYKCHTVYIAVYMYVANHISVKTENGLNINLRFESLIFSPTLGYYDWNQHADTLFTSVLRRMLNSWWKNERYKNITFIDFQIFYILNLL